MNTPRLVPLARTERSEEQQRILEDVGSEKNIFTTLVRHPLLFDDFRQFSGRLLRQSTLPDRDRELLILRTAFRCQADYQWAQHIESALRIGVSEQAVAAAGGATVLDLDEHVALLLIAADQLLIRRGLDDSTWLALRHQYSDEQMIELCMLVGECGMVAAVLNSLGVPLEPGQSQEGWLTPGQ